MTRIRTASGRIAAILSTTALSVATLCGCSTFGPPYTLDSLTDAGTSSTGTSSEPGGGAAESGDCLLGAWSIPEDQMQGYYDQVGNAANFEVVGNTGIEFAADSYEYTPDFTLKMTVAGHDAEGTLVGSIRGSYTSDGKSITTMNDSSDISMTITVMGQTVDAGEEFNKMMGISPINSAAYSCEGGAPVIMFLAGDKPPVPVRLAPAA